MKRESEALCEILLTSSRLGIAWRNNIGQAHDRVTGQHIKFGGPPGTSDVLGVVAIPGHRFGIPLAAEAKSDTGRQSPDQKLFEQAWTKAGGLYVLARSSADLEAAISAALEDVRAHGR